MKKILYLLTFVALCLSGCEEDDTNQTLPPPTQTGKNIIACKIDGKSFVHKDSDMNCYYQDVDGQLFFSIQGRNEDNIMRTVVLSTNNKSINEFETLILQENKSGNAWAGGRFQLSEFETQGAYTDSEYIGEMHITKFDTEKQIVSGTFWFDVKHPVTGKRVEVRDGRFDAQYGQ